MTAPRYTYVMRSAEKAHTYYKFFQSKGLNPEVINPPDPAYAHAVWRVEYDGKPMLAKDYLQPNESARHWLRPEYEYAYGLWFGEQKPDFERCCASVSSNLGGPHQCNAKAKEDPDYTGKPTRCKVHSRAHRAAKKAKAAAKHAADLAVWKSRHNALDLQRAAVELIKQIAAGHNDPRGAAQELLEKYGAGSPPEQKDEY